MKPERTTPPRIKKIDTLKLPDVEKVRLSNGMPVYLIEMGTQEVIKIELAFYAGRPFEKRPLTGRATASLIKEGSSNFTSSDIAEQLDYYGCTLSTPTNLDTSNLIFYSLNKHLPNVLPILADIIQFPSFAQSELENFQKRNIQRLAEDLTKNEVLSYREITELIFSPQHPYGYNSDADMYRNIKRSNLLKHHQHCYNAQNGAIFVSGKITPDILNMIDDYFSKAIPAGVPVQGHFPEVVSNPIKKQIKRKDSLQASIRIGRRLFNRAHPDYQGMYVLNNILGGYFGSRLMANVREDKGYTYNIYSMIDAMNEDGYFYIGTEAGANFTNETLQEIYKEMGLLQDELVNDEELEMVRNYLLGNFLTMLDGPFNVSEVVKTLIMEKLPLSYFASLVETVQQISANQLQMLAQKYLNKEDMYQVVVSP